MGENLLTQQALETQVKSLQNALQKAENELAHAATQEKAARAAGAQAGLDLAAARTRSASPEAPMRQGGGSSRPSPTAVAQVLKLEEAVARQQMEITHLQATNTQQVQAYAELHGLKLRELEEDLLRTQLNYHPTGAFPYNPSCVHPNCR